MNRVSSHIEHRGRVAVVSLAGDVDIAQVQGLRERVLSAVRNADLGLVIDLTAATYIDSVGVSLLFELAERLGERHLHMAVVLPQDGLVERVLKIVDLKAVAEVHRGVDDAVAAVGPG